MLSLISMFPHVFPIVSRYGWSSNHPFNFFRMSKSIRITIFCKYIPFNQHFFWENNMFLPIFSVLLGSLPIFTANPGELPAPRWCWASRRCPWARRSRVLSPSVALRSGSLAKLVEGSSRVKLPTIWRDGKAEVGRVSEEKSRSEKIRDGESQKKEDAGARKGREVAIHCVFPMIWGSGGSKSNLAKAEGAERVGQMRDQKLHAIVARSTFPVKMYKTPHVRSTFGSSLCRKSARRCGAKHISKSKITKHTNLGPLLEVQLSEKCTPLWCEARLRLFWR